MPTDAVSLVMNRRELERNAGGRFWISLVHILKNWRVASSSLGG
jgi:hypothetical protein